MATEEEIRKFLDDNPAPTRLCFVTKQKQLITKRWAMKYVPCEDIILMKGYEGGSYLSAVVAEKENGELVFSTRSECKRQNWNILYYVDEGISKKRKKIRRIYKKRKYRWEYTLKRYKNGNYTIYLSPTAPIGEGFKTLSNALDAIKNDLQFGRIDINK